MSQPSSTSYDFPKAGISVSFLSEFLQDCGGRNALKNLTTEEVCERFIKPKTKATQSSYCDFLRDKGHKDYKETANIFISHAHVYNFLDIVDALLFHFQGEVDDINIWFDIFSINQHQTACWTFDWLSKTFKDFIKQCDRTTMVLSPWNDPVPFSRAWCIYEVLCTSEARKTFDIALGEKGRNQFLEDVRKSSVEESINQMLASIRSEKSQCFKEEDRRAIFSAIEASVGFLKIDSMLFEQYRDWVITVGMDALADCNEAIERLHLLELIGSLYRGQGKYKEAYPFLKVCFDKRKSTLGMDHPNTLNSMFQLATLYCDQGQYRRAFRLSTECHKRRASTLGTNNPDTLRCMGLIGRVYRKLGPYEKAHKYCEECQKEMVALRGEDHLDSLSSMHELASVYRDSRQWDKAHSLYERCWEGQKVLLGENHPDTLWTMSDVAAVVGFAKEDHDKALQLAKRCWEKERSILGEDHPSTVWTKCQVALAYSKQSNHDEALKLFQECFDFRKHSLGTDHPDTIWTMGELASVYWKKGEVGKGLSLYKQCDAKWTSDKKYLRWMERWAKHHYNEAEYDQAYCVLKKLVVRSTSMHGENNPFTVSSKKELAAVKEMLSLRKKSRRL